MPQRPAKQPNIVVMFIAHCLQAVADQWLNRGQQRRKERMGKTEDLHTELEHTRAPTDVMGRFGERIVVRCSYSAVLAESH